MQTYQLDSAECKALELLYRRKTSMLELLNALSSDCIKESVNEDFYQKVINEFAEVNEQINKWWCTIAKNKKWEDLRVLDWKVDFYSKEIHLNVQETV